MAAAPAPDPPTAPPPPPQPPTSGGPIPPRPSPVAAPLRPPISRSLLSPTPPNKSDLVSANRAVMRALSVPSRPLSAIDQAAASYLRRQAPPPPPPLAPSPVRPPVSPVEQAARSNPPGRPPPPPPQAPVPVQPQPVPVQTQPLPQAQPQFVPPPRPITAPRTVPPIRMVPKAMSYPVVSSVPEFSNRKDRERREINVATIRSRKVRLFERGSDSLYALCRSWLRNGLPQDCQPNYGDGIKLLPRPFPASLIDSNSSERSEDDTEADDLEKEERAGSAEELSTQDLLAGLVKRSKRVRQKLKKERDRRIARYNQRLSLLLPPVDMARSDATPGS